MSPTCHATGLLHCVRNDVVRALRVPMKSRRGTPVARVSCFIVLIHRGSHLDVAPGGVSVYNATCFRYSGTSSTLCIL